MYIGIGVFRCNSSRSKCLLSVTVGSLNFLFNHYCTELAIKYYLNEESKKNNEYILSRQMYSN